MSDSLNTEWSGNGPSSQHKVWQSPTFGIFTFFSRFKAMAQDNQIKNQFCMLEYYIFGNVSICWIDRRKKKSAFQFRNNLNFEPDVIECYTFCMRTDPPPCISLKNFIIFTIIQAMNTG